jgi:PmbA protein
MTDLMVGAEQLLGLARAQGAQEAQVRVSRTEERKIGIERNATRLSASGDETVYSLKVHAEHRLGSAQTNSPLPEDLRRCAEAALAMAKFAEPDEALNLPGPMPEALPTSRFDPALAEIPVRRLHEMASEFLAEMKADPRLSVDSGQINWSREEEGLVNSHGVSRRDNATRIVWAAMGMGVEGDQVTTFDVETGLAHWLADAEQRVPEGARNLRERVLRTFRPGRCASYKGAVLVSPGAFLEMLASDLGYHLSGLQVLYGKSAWNDDCVGTLVASPLLSVVDDPTDLSLGGCCNFDGEGVPTREMEIIQAGVLGTHLENAYSARRRNRMLTGHAALSLHSLTVGAGPDFLDDMMRAREPLLFLRRFSGRGDPATGDFSGVAKGSFLMEGGEQRPVQETMVAGNFFSALRSILAVSSAREPVYGAARVPYLLIDGISVTGQ